jgi:cytochrome c551/c552
MIPCKPLARKLTLFVLLFFVFSIFNFVSAQDGKAIFNSRCASCHIMGKDATGPNLQGVVDRWGGKVEDVTLWIKNWNNAVKAGIPRAVEVQAYDKSVMTAFEGVINDAEIAAVIKYVDEWKPEEKADTGGAGGGGKSDNSNAVIFGVISLILGIIALILMQVNSNLKKMSDDAEGVRRPDPVPFYRNKIYIAMFALVAFAVAGFFASKAAIGFGRQKGYQPVQPIYYSHKVHAGINQISCLYCHGSAWDSKHAAIPAVNICMNCHKTITDYQGPKLYDESGKEIDGTQEIQKLYSYAGFDPKNPSKWDPTKARPIEWVKIHNLPDHVYFNHSQHIRAGNVQCQTCHGEITAMDEVKQVSELSMGWCVNCHRETKVNFNYSDSTGNKFYSIYEKFHNDLKTTELNRVASDLSLKPDQRKFKIDSIMKTRRMDSVSVKDIGGLECQKCHY